MRSSYNRELYISSTAVVLMELLKVIICLWLLLKEERYNVRLWWRLLRQEVFSRGALPLFIPSFLYAIQASHIILVFALIDCL